MGQTTLVESQNGNKNFSYSPNGNEKFHFLKGLSNSSSFFFLLESLTNI